MFSLKLRAIILTFCALTFVNCGNSSLADEVIIDDQKQVSLGDFRCSNCPTPINTAMGILNQSQSGEVSAGELWRFFNEQGVDSLDRLTLCLDVDQLDGNAAFDLQSVELKIEDPLVQGQLLTNVSMGNNTMVVPGFETSSFRPEARLEIALGYDFMQRFSADSEEKIKLDFSSNSEHASNVKFSIEGDDSNLFSGLNFILLAAFVGFWIMVFFVLNRMTKPLAPVEAEPETPSPQQTVQPSIKVANGGSKQAISA